MRVRPDGEREVEIERFLAPIVGPNRVLGRRELGQVSAGIAGEGALWEDLVVHDPRDRWYLLLYRCAQYNVWLLSWLAGQNTDWHDHGGSSGSFAVAAGQLSERFRRGATRTGARVLQVGGHADFGPAHLHCVTHDGELPAVSVHCYSPPLVAMTYYERTELGWRASETVRSDAPDGRGWKRSGQVSYVRRSIDTVLSDARSRIERLAPQEAARAVAAGAVLVDIRPGESRRAEGEVPGAVAIERNVLQWRFDPLSEARLVDLAGYDRRLIVMCSDGSASSLAADDLRRLGIHRVADLDGGFMAWRQAGLPTRPGEGT